MITLLDPLRDLQYTSILLKLFLALIFGGMLGLERGRKGRPAGFRTYMLVCMGATITTMLGQYLYLHVKGPWAEIAAVSGFKADVTRMGAEVLNGLGFLGAGTIIISGRQEVKGLTTATCLWSAGSLGLAIGAGFYEAVVFTGILLYLTIGVLPVVEARIIEHSRDMNIYIEFDSINHLGRIIARLRSCELHIYDIDVDYADGKFRMNPSAVFYTRIESPKVLHNNILSNISDMDEVRNIKEI